jgi:hypothetical protein
MSRDSAYKHAQIEANRNACPIAVVNAPIENAEDSGGPYGYATPAGVPILYRHG